MQISKLCRTCYAYTVHPKDYAHGSPVYTKGYAHVSHVACSLIPVSSTNILPYYVTGSEQSSDVSEETLGNVARTGASLPHRLSLGMDK